MATVHEPLHEGVDAVLRTEGLSVWYGERRALRHVSISIPRNTAVALIGPSGGGKTTLLRSFNRMVELDPEARHEGRILLDERDIHAAEVEPLALRRRVGMVFPSPNPFPKSIFENVAFALRLAGADDVRGRVERALRRVALWDEVADRLREPAAQLSGGQQQRLCVARALALDPAVILFDEPTLELDPVAGARIEELVYELKEEVGIVFVTHSLQQAARVSDYTAFVYMGELVEYGPTDVIFTNPLEERTEAYVTGRFG
jgi:phosphate transport system ATP-binding protein